jgi:uncharacterized membrane protein YdjX (TVP38/TMEM64 family)
MEVCMRKSAFKYRRSFPVLNLLLPIWLLVWFPSWLWVILIPANFLIDYLVLRWSLKDMEDCSEFCKKNVWKVCAIGFISDFMGTLVLIIAMVILGEFEDDVLVEIGSALGFNPFGNPIAFAITVVAIIVAGICIFFLDRWILNNSALDREHAQKAAIRLAIITAPYLFLLPTTILYTAAG